MNVMEVLEHLKAISLASWDDGGNVLHYYATKAQEDLDKLDDSVLTKNANLEPTKVTKGEDQTGDDLLAKAESLVGRQVEVVLEYDKELEGSVRASVIARGRLVGIDELGQVVVIDDVGFAHHCLALLDIKEV